MDVVQRLKSITGESKERFVREKHILTFEQYLAQFVRLPHLLGRNASQYLLGAIHHHGSVPVKRPEGTRRRFSIFDAVANKGNLRLVGQEEVQEEFYEALVNQVREGNASRLILLHGPNGSAKTSFVQCLARALVDYSHRDEGAIYAFNWVFPKTGTAGKRLGFEKREEEAPPADSSYALLEEPQIAARIPGDLRDNPLFLLPQEQRYELLKSLESDGLLPEGFRFSQYLLNGDLTPGSRAVFDALLAAYGGDLARVLAHVQVERFHFSRRYRRGIVTIEPQMHVDASARQITMDESYASLPPVLRHISLVQLSGDLVDGNRGLVEFSDLLKRPVDAFKYLLSTCESSRVDVAGVVLYLDMVLLGTTNDKYLHAFTKSPDFSSFKGRMELVKVPYIRNYVVETDIYLEPIRPEAIGKPIAPHAIEMAALWAVLTRMRKPDPQAYPEALRPVLAELSPLQKAELYAHGTPPPGLHHELARLLIAHIPDLYREFDGRPDYEGFIGASAREIRNLLFVAAQAAELPCLHPVQVFREIEDLIRNPAMYEFLQVAPAGAYHDPSRLLEATRKHYLAILEGEFRQAMGLVGPEDFGRLLEKYALHASAFLKKERVLDPVTRKEVPPDETFLSEMEDLWGSQKNRIRAREDFLGRIASFSLDHQGQLPEYATLFGDHLAVMAASYYKEHEREVSLTLSQVLEHLEGVAQEPEIVQRVAALVTHMKDQLGYDDRSLPMTLTWLASNRAARGTTHAS